MPNKKAVLSVIRLTVLVLLSLGKPLCFLHAIESQSEPPYYVYKITDLQTIDRKNPSSIRRIWDETLLVSALQGLVNRDSARLFLLYIEAYGHNVDEYWLEKFSHEIQCADGTTCTGWLQKRERRSIDSLESLLDIFSDSYKGVILYDERVRSSVNVALTIAGTKKLLPIRYDPTSGSLYNWLVASPSGKQLPVVERLINEDGSPMFTGKGIIPGTTLNSTGSTKADAYHWMIEKYMKTGQVNLTEGGYYIDSFWIEHPNGLTQNHCLTNRDFVISRQGFFFDLSPWDDEAPNDDPYQQLGVDYNTFKSILQTVYKGTTGQQIIRISGFTPWDTKYTNHGNVGGKHSSVSTEWRHAELLSNYNCYLDADALGLGAMANASFYQHFPLQKRYPQQKPTIETLKIKGLIDENERPVDRTFVAIYFGDYDSSAWVYQAESIFWDDPARGVVPISWALNPNLADRIAPVFDYCRKTQSANDFFISGDSGAGYINPMSFVEPRRFSGYPDNLDVWIQHCLNYFKQWDLTGIGFVIDGDAPTCDRTTLSRLSEYSPDGIITHRGTAMGVVVNKFGDNTPFRPMNSDLLNLEHGKQTIIGDVRFNRGAQFNVYRVILWSPSQMKQLFDSIKELPKYGKRIEFVDMYTLWLLMKLESKALQQDEFDLRL